MKNRKTTTAAYAANNNTHTPTTSIEDEANRIVELEFDSFVKNRDALCLAYYASHPCTSAKMLRLPKGDYRRHAAETARVLHRKPARVQRLIAAGYFEDQLRVLLEIARKNPKHGAKLVQVFVCMLVHWMEYGLSEALAAELEAFIKMRVSHDGFLILAEDDTGSTLLTAV